METCGIVARKIPENISRKRNILAFSSSVLSFHPLQSRPRRVLSIRKNDNSSAQNCRESSFLVLHLVLFRSLIVVVTVSSKRKDHNLIMENIG